MIYSPGYSLPNIIQEIAKEDEEKQKRHLRRIVAKQERLKSRPPRLGKHKYGCFLHKDIFIEPYAFSLMIYCNWLVLRTEILLKYS